MIKNIINRLIKIDHVGNYPDTYLDELDRQCYAIAFVCALIESFYWLFYIRVDKLLHPQEVLIVYLRLGLSAVALISLVVYFRPRFKYQGILLLNISYAYIIIATGLITALTKAHAPYVGGYIFVIMCSIIVPLPKKHVYISMGISGLSYFLICFLKGVRFDSVAEQYSLNDLIGVFFISSVFVYVLDIIRFKSYSKSKEVEIQRLRIETANAQMQQEIEEHKRTQEALRLAKDAAEAASQAKSAFLATMSHEIRTPMNGVIGMTSLLLDTPLTAEQHSFTETIRASGESLLLIINDILDFSKIEANKMELETQPFNVRECIESARELLDARAREKGLALSCTIEDQTPIGVQGDITRVRQILINLISNAIKFTETGKIMVNVSGHPEPESIPNGPSAGSSKIFDLHFMISDTGIGIPPDRMNRLFQSFSQVDSSTSRKYGGTGLGLAISQRLCELMGGRMWAESEVGKGSTFHFTIRTEIADATSRTLRRLQCSISGFDVKPSQGYPGLSLFDKEMSKRLPHRILLTEDNAVNQKLALRILERFGYQADVAGNGFEALEAVQRQFYDVILMDMQMPEMDGLEATRQIRKTISPENQPRIIAMTANALKEDRDRCLAAGMDDYITKPVRVEELVAALNKCQPRPKSAEEQATQVLQAQDSNVTVPLTDIATFVMPSLNERKPEVPTTDVSLDPKAVAQLWDMVDNDAEFLTELIDKFIQHGAPQLLAEMRQACAQEDAATLSRAAHSLKSNAANFGASKLQKLCKELELSSKTGSLTGANEFISQIQAAYDEIIPALNSLRQK